MAAGCAGTPAPLPPTGSLGATQLAQQVSASQALHGVRVTFHYSDYFSLTSPDLEGCAGDARNYYDPIALIAPNASSQASVGFGSVAGFSGLSAVTGATGATGPLLLPPDVTGTSQTIRPSFIKNISVDMTDANANVPANQAFACSLGQGTTVPATSSCATFDYGAIGGIPSNMGGTMLVIGGVQNYNYSGILPSALQTSFPPEGMSLGCGPVTSSVTTQQGYTQCNSGIFALGVNTLPADAFNSNPNLMPAYIGTQGPTGPVSMWANISGTPGFTGPQGGAGAMASYDPGLQKVLLFGGAAPLANLGSNAPGVTTYDTWFFDLKAQQWTYLTANIYLTNKLMTLFDTMIDFEQTGNFTVATNFAPLPQQIQKPVGARALFGYLPVPGMGMRLDAMNNSGTMTAAMIDGTERLMIVGGLGGGGAFSGTHRFNPTYGPEIQNIVATANNINSGGSGLPTVSPITPFLPVQWADSYHTQLMDNTYGGAFVPQSAPGTAIYSTRSSHFTLDTPPLNVGPTGGQPVINSGFAPLVNNAGAGVRGTGYILGAGGFDLSVPTNKPDGTGGDTAATAACTTNGGATVVANAVPPYYTTNTDLRCGGGMTVLTRFYQAGNGAANETNTSHWGSVPNFLDANALPNTPALWTQVTEKTDGSATTQIVPLLGGVSMLPGFNLVTNDVVYFGGIDCRSYTSDTSSVCNMSTFKNPGRYWIFGGNPVTTTPAGAAGPITPPMAPANSSNIPPDSSGGWAGSMSNGNPAPGNFAPTQAGMATARGLDPAGNVIVLAWGGSKGAAQIEGRNRVYYMINTVALPAVTPQWGYASQMQLTVQGTPPTELIGASMVFSHVTRKFYVFGGYDPSTQLTRGDTYELSISSPGNAACSISGGTSGNCVFTWRQLNQSTGVGLTCYPSGCPPARRSHRMAEVNYFNRNPGGNTVAAGYTVDGEQPCTQAAPCSYGIFMEGGTPDGFTYLSDRWMFDPTANGGSGHWQRMNEFPPRALGAMASADYALPVNGQVVHRAILFGGETGMHNPEWGAAKPSGTLNSFVAPTLGDTWMFDYDSQSWNRVELMGKGYTGFARIPGNTAGSGTEIDRRQGYDATTNPPQFKVAGDVGAAYGELSPPALSGAVMVTRTQAPPQGGASNPTLPLSTLPLPEVYLFGGRLKDGSFNILKNVYKFCAGSTGEAFTLPPTQANSTPNPQDFTCDAFDANKNPASPNPSAGYVGRWITKKPDGVTATGLAINLGQVASYLGAGAYDITRDRIVLFGGLTSLGTMDPPASVNTAVTDSANLIADANVYEYTPPQPQLAGATPPSATPREGRWTFVPSCAGYPAPVGRYGHSMAYNTRGQNILIMGGYDAHGTPLTTTIQDYSSNTSYKAPEVWTGTYCSDPSCGDLLPRPGPGQPPISLTNAPCYFWQPITSFGNSTAILAQLPPETGIAHAASIFVPSTGYNLGYYTMIDSACPNEGPIASPDPSLNKLLAGGVYIDIDRSQLGAAENLLLNITYLPMGTNNLAPDATHLTMDESAVFRVHLIKTGQTQQQLMGALQPRYMGYSDTQQYQKTVQSLSVLAPPTGQIAQEQIMVPISVDPGIDRIRIERYSGTGILLDAAVYRMGTK